MATDRAQAIDMIMNLSAIKSVDVPITLTFTDIRSLAQMQMQSANAFDNHFLETVQQGHQRRALACEATADRVHDPLIKSFAHERIAALQPYVQLATRIRKPYSKEATADICSRGTFVRE